MLGGSRPEVEVDGSVTGRGDERNHLEDGAPGGVLEGRELTAREQNCAGDGAQTGKHDQAEPELLAVLHALAVAQRPGWINTKLVAPTAMNATRIPCTPGPKVPVLTGRGEMPMVETEGRAWATTSKSVIAGARPAP